MSVTTAWRATSNTVWWINARISDGLRSAWNVWRALWSNRRFRFGLVIAEVVVIAVLSAWTLR